MDHPRGPDEEGRRPPIGDGDARGPVPGFDPASDAPAPLASPSEPDQPGHVPGAAAVRTEGPLDPATARSVLERADELMATGDYAEAGAHYRRVIGTADAGVTAAALFGLGLALYRLDREDDAIAAWQSVLELPETPSTYRAWREIASARVRDADLAGAITAYRQADRRAPAEDKAEIAARLGWLAKETGNTGASRKYFAKSRGSGPAVPVAWVIVGLTVVVSFMAFSRDGHFLFEALQLDKPAVANGEMWRLWSVTLLHGSLVHLLFNMYALYISGPLVETLYGSRLFLLFYLLCAAAGSVASFVFGGNVPAVGASGAIFGLFGLLLAASRTHHPVLDRRSRSLVGQLGTLILINLVFGFVVPNIDNAAHIGGLVAGLWLGFLLVPGRVPTLRSLWQGASGTTRKMTLPAVGIGALVVVLGIGVLVGTEMRQPTASVEHLTTPRAVAARPATSGTSD